VNQIKIPRDAVIMGEQLIGLMEILTELPINGEDVAASIVRGVNNGHLIKKPRDGKTPDERAADRATKEELGQDIYNWLRENQAPSYDGAREHACNAAEVLDRIGIARDRRSLALVRKVLESESTGWGLVDIIEGQRLYAQKAALLTFRKAA